MLILTGKMRVEAMISHFPRNSVMPLSKNPPIDAPIQNGNSMAERNNFPNIFVEIHLSHRKFPTHELPNISADVLLRGWRRWTFVSFFLHILIVDLLSLPQPCISFLALLWQQKKT